MNISGRPSVALRPSSSQSVAVISLNRFKDPQGVEILHGFAEMLFELWILALRLGKRRVKENLALGGDLFDGCGLVVRGEFVVDQLQDAKLANLSVDRAAVRAVLGLSALFVDLFANLGASQVVDERPAELREKLPAMRLLEQDTTAVLCKSPAGWR